MEFNSRKRKRQDDTPAGKRYRDPDIVPITSYKLDCFSCHHEIMIHRVCLVCRFCRKPYHGGCQGISRKAAWLKLEGHQGWEEGWACKICIKRPDVKQTIDAFTRRNRVAYMNRKARAEEEALCEQELADSLNPSQGEKLFEEDNMLDTYIRQYEQ
jgi:hypothetical protein